MYQVAHIRPLDVLEHDVPNAAVLAHVVDAGNVRMIQPRGGAGLRLKAALRLIARLKRGEYLHRYGAVQLRIPGTEHGPHPTATDKLLQHDQIELLPL